MPSDKQIAREIVKSWKKEDCISAYHPRLGRLERRIAAALAAARQPEQVATVARCIQEVEEVLDAWNGDYEQYALSGAPTGSAAREQVNRFASEIITALQSLAAAPTETAAIAAQEFGYTPEKDSIEPLDESEVRAKAEKYLNEKFGLSTPPEGELLPCPFCGATAGDVKLSRGHGFIIGCSSCQGQQFALERDEAVRMWNTRALPAAPAECLMADCVEPQAHFCVTHVLEVHTAPTDEQFYEHDGKIFRLEADYSQPAPVPEIINEDLTLPDLGSMTTDKASSLNRAAYKRNEEYNALRCERDELREALREFVASGVEFDDSRMNYVVMQIDREALERARKLIETN